MKSHKSLLIFVLTIGVFGILNTEMGIIGIIPQIADMFGVTVPQAGMLVAGFALVIAVSGPIMPLLFSGFNRKTVMLLVLSIFVVSNIVSVFASSFTMLLIARLIPAAFQPVYVSIAFAVAAGSVKKSEAPKAVAWVFIGVSGGFVLGVPVTSFIATEFSFAASMVFFAVINISALIATIIVMPSMPVTEKMSYGTQLQVLKKPILWLSAMIVILFNASVFGFFSYMSDFLDIVTALSMRTISLLLFIYGLSNILGNIIAGKTLTNNANKTVMLLPFALAISYSLLFAAGHLGVAAAVMMLVIGVLAGILANANQYLITDSAPEAPIFANGLFLTAGNLGVTFGAAFCGMFITAFNTRYTLVGSVIMLALSVVFIFVRLYLLKKMNCMQTQPIVQFEHS